ncbi:hypothetical protein [Actinomadura sp. DC4]|uniref:hypothetical protein n=1 Tax=Actinomadura sp. DC4 TaxID=3055069 RepID=UPI0025B24F4B|nr:hypothetical protein [Actinomadura sp. DC4]MDN3357777.1 hypothetical protein [Actinomadura sp. DC4]
MLVSTRRSEVVAVQAGSVLVVRAADAAAAEPGHAAALAAEPYRTIVVVEGSAAAELDELSDELVADLQDLVHADAYARGGPAGWGIRLVAPRMARPDASRADPLAGRLADRLGLEVIAPDGELVTLRGGELFSAGPGAGWVGFRPGHDPEWSGPRYPAPVWQAALSGVAPSRGTTVTSIPAGLWVRVAGAAALPLVDLGFGVPAEPHRPIVLVGAPGEDVPGVAELAALYEAFPAEIRESAVLAPYGQDPRGCAALAQSLADRLGFLVRGYHALPHYAADGDRRFAVFGAGGGARPERLSEAPEAFYRPTAPARPRRESVGPAAYGTGLRAITTRDPWVADDLDELDPATYVISDLTVYADGRP